MAWQVSKRVWENVPASITKNDRLMLLALAEYADEHGVCWPSYDTLAPMVGVDPRTAIRLIQHLEKEKQIINFEQSGQRGGRGNTNLYLVITGLTETEVDKVINCHPVFIQKGDKIYTLYEQKKGDIFGQKGDKIREKGDKIREKGDTAVSPEPYNHYIEPSKNHQSAKPANQRPKIIPALKVFVEVIGKSNTLNAAQIKAIDEAVGRDPPALELWREAVKAWNLNGNKLTDAAGMLDWFKSGKRSNYTPKNGGTNGHSKQRATNSGDVAPPAGIDPAIWQRLNQVERH